MDASKVSPSEAGSGSNTDNSVYGDHTNTLGKRLIGIAIVIGLSLIGLFLWVRIAKWPRRKLRKLGCTCLPEPRRSKKSLAEEASRTNAEIAEHHNTTTSQGNGNGSGNLRLTIPASDYKSKQRSPEENAAIQTAEADNKQIRGGPSFTYVAHWPSKGRHWDDAGLKSTSRSAKA
ncbi:hypothetical protein E1B28_001132 [Marasmius oreades]|uniref:Uncharacterized protein n=1 Tax=Marasmius oreades TaxID=181124 RepID=A0A9P7V2Y3_9AGAR|nr:uncharacterized protein E1B28_001132 [Marasmius oreades]KAG7099272.1 hypothetical protein E1B28_001132 [Marasmius oreades]